MRAMSLWAVTPKATRELETNMLDRLGRSIAYLHKGMKQQVYFLSSLDWSFELSR